MLDLRLIRNTILFGITLFGVQGTIYLFQLGAAVQMSPTDYSKVRIIESLVTIGALLATFGLPSIALVRIGTASSEGEQRGLVAIFCTVVAAFSLVTAAGYMLANHFGFLRNEIESVMGPILGITGLMAFRLLLTSIGQARQNFLFLATVSAAGCLLAIAGYGVLVWIGVGQVAAWLLARGSLEALICLCLAMNELRLGRVVPFGKPSKESARKNFTLVALSALPIGASLLARSLVDHGPVLWLAAIGASPEIVAQVGVFVTLATMSLMPGLVVQGVAVPRLVLNIRDRRGSGGYGVLFIGMCFVTSLIFAGLVVLSTFFLKWGLLAQVGVLTSGMILVLAKMGASATGGYLLAYDRRHTILRLNLLTLGVAAVAAALLFWQQGRLELLSVVGLLAAVEAFAAICYGVAAFGVSQSARLSSRRG